MPKLTEKGQQAIRDLELVAAKAKSLADELRSGKKRNGLEWEVEECRRLLDADVGRRSTRPTGVTSAIPVDDHHPNWLFDHYHPRDSGRYQVCRECAAELALEHGEVWRGRHRRFCQTAERWQAGLSIYHPKAKQTEPAPRPKARLAPTTWTIGDQSRRR